MPISTPTKIVTPWATSGLKNAIPQASDNITGAAGYDAGFPAITMTPKVAGGIPPQGQDFNGAFFDLTTALQFLEAGGSFPFDSAFATAVGGYPIGALVSRSDNSGLWRNTVANNTTNPETFGAGWQPEGGGISVVPMASANVTLTALQAARPVIIVTGNLTANLILSFPQYQKQWLVVLDTGGAFTVTCRTSTGGSVAVRQGTSQLLFVDNSNQMRAVNPVSAATEAAAGIIAIATQGEVNTGTDDSKAVTALKLRTLINAFGVGSISPPYPGADLNNLTTFSSSFGVTTGCLNTPPGFTVQGSVVMTNLWQSAGIIQQTYMEHITGRTARRAYNGTWGAWDVIVTTGTSSVILNNTLGYNKTYTDVTGARSSGTSYTNATSAPIQVTVTIAGADGNSDSATVVVGGVTVFSGDTGVNLQRTPITFVVPNGASYTVTVVGTSITRWVELR